MAFGGGVSLCVLVHYIHIYKTTIGEKALVFLLNNLSDMYSFKAILKEISSVKNSGIAGWPKSQ